MPSDTEPLFARFIFDRRHLRNNGTARLGAFMPEPETRQTSVYRIDSIIPDESSIWQLATKRNDKPVKARADVCQAIITRADLYTEPEASEHPLHHNIIGWPDDRLQQQQKAKDLADAANFTFAPKRD